MKLVFKILTFALVVVSMSACIDPLEVDTKESRQLLVVEGAVTTLPGPHRILLSKSDKYGSVFDGFIKKETGATVWVRDNEGEQVILKEMEPGSYDTPAGFSAEVGKKYTLHVNLANGERYISTPQEVLPVPPIDSLTILFKIQPSLDAVSLNTGIEVYVRWQDPKDVANFYMWETDGVYLLNTRPDLHEGRDGQGNTIPMPKDCCSRCYVYEYGLSSDLRIFKDNLTDGNNNAELVLYLQDDRKRFMEKYMIVVKQMSLTKEAYQFYDVLRNQLSIQGNIFDPPPATIRSNMINLGQPDQAVIGFFRASDVQTDTLFIPRSDIESPRQILQINDDCRVFENSTTTKPPFWE